MEILAHRGLWEKTFEKNDLKVLIKALENGFGIETDIRDLNGELVISHDPPLINKEAKILKLEDLLRAYKKTKSNKTLALNIKSDGISGKLKFYLDKYNINNYFVFDTSIPDFLNYYRYGLTIFSRSSEFENPNLLRKISNGLWIDGFSKYHFENIDLEIISNDWERICFVSPELHDFSFEHFWKKLKIFINNENKTKNIKMYICTDKPIEAKNYFKI